MASLFQLAHTSAADTGHNSSTHDGLRGNTPGLAYLQFILQTWLNLDLATAAAFLTIIGVVFRAAQELSGVAVNIYWWIIEWFTSSITIAGNDRLNSEVLNWLGVNIINHWNLRTLAATSEHVPLDLWQYRLLGRQTSGSGDTVVPLRYLPTFSLTCFTHEGYIFIVKRIQPPPDGPSSYMSRVPKQYGAAPGGSEDLVVMCLSLSPAPIQRFLEICHTFSNTQRKNAVTVYFPLGPEYGCPEWSIASKQPIRPLSTVHLDARIKQALVDDIKAFLSNDHSQFCANRGLGYRKGYLLYGPPGTGKTSVALALAGLFGLDLFMLHLPSIDNDNYLLKLFNDLPVHCIVLLEDIDAVGIEKRSPPISDSASHGGHDNTVEDQQFRPQCRWTLSGLLNVLDGALAKRGRIVIMTSNFDKKLDPALIRAGRIDKQIYLGNVSTQSAKQMFLRIYGGDSGGNTDAAAGEATIEKDGDYEARLAELARQFGSRIPDNTLSPAQLEAYLVSHLHAPKAALAGLEQWIADEKSLAENRLKRSKT